MSWKLILLDGTNSILNDMAAKKDARYWLTAPFVSAIDGPEGMAFWHMFTPLGRIIAVPQGGLLADLFSDSRRYPWRLNFITCAGIGYMPNELLAETYFAFGHPKKCIRILQGDPTAAQKVVNIEHEIQIQPDISRIDEFVNLGKAIRARQDMDMVMQEIQSRRTG